MRTCEHPGCGLKHSSHGYCSAHAAQWTRSGRTWEIGGKEPEPVAERIEHKVVVEGACRIWTGTKNPNGYGTISWLGRPWLVHRAAWTEQRGPIPDGLTIDHLCRNRACVSVDHMEVVTLAENARRGGGLEVSWRNRRAKAHCKHGHELTPENVYIQADGGRRCRTCSVRYTSEWARRAGRRRPRILKPCGTTAAYERHRKAGEYCATCRAAKAAAERARRSGRRAELPEVV